MAKPKTKTPRTPERREDGLSRERIVATAIELLDTEGEDGLTFRALATRLSTGPGAIYWHITNKNELLVAATDAVVTRALAGVGTHSAPNKAIRNIALNVFDTVDAHPWMGSQLAWNPRPTAMMQIFERIGRQLQALGVKGRAQFTAATVLVSYIIGESRENAANGRTPEPRPDRTEFLETVAAEWKALDAREYPFTRNIADQLRTHDDRAEFLAGIDLILAGIGASL